MNSEAQEEWAELNPALTQEEVEESYKDESSRWERRRDRELARNNSVPSFKAGHEGQNRKHWN